MTYFCFFSFDGHWFFYPALFRESRAALLCLSLNFKLNGYLVTGEAVYFCSKKTTKDHFVIFTFWSWPLHGLEFPLTSVLSAVVTECTSILSLQDFLMYFVIQKSLFKNRMRWFLFNSFVVERSTLHFKYFMYEDCKDAVIFWFKTLLVNPPMTVAFSALHVFICSFFLECILWAGSRSQHIAWTDRQTAFPSSISTVETVQWW